MNSIAERHSNIDSRAVSIESDPIDFQTLRLYASGAFIAQFKPPVAKNGVDFSQAKG